MSTRNRSLKGFTILELIIGMAIVAVLMGLGIAGITTLQQSTRNTERRNALQSVYTEVEAMRGDFGAYPEQIKVVTYSTSSTVIVLCQRAGSGTSCGTGGSRNVTLANSAYIVQNSTENSSNTTESVYCYSRPSATSFSVAVLLEGGANPFAYGSAPSCWDTTNNTIPAASANRIK